MEKKIRHTITLVEKDSSYLAKLAADNNLTPAKIAALLLSKVLKEMQNGENNGQIKLFTKKPKEIFLNELFQEYTDLLVADPCFKEKIKSFLESILLSAIDK